MSTTRSYGQRARLSYLGVCNGVVAVHTTIALAPECVLRLGEPSCPVPERSPIFCSAGSQPGLHVRRDEPYSHWLFPGRRAGQPMHPDALAALVNDLGIPAGAGRALCRRMSLAKFWSERVSRVLQPQSC
ncbi:MAG TPA: hypothetical protein VHO07_17115 [Streptosporangiaceae bacterium]|jgi:hypothetical protein|nr:hypothetical protein [Streptosporangiaceae bacterium]